MDFRDHPVNRLWTPAEKIGLLRVMIRIRRFEQRAMKEYIWCQMGGLLLLSIGQESVAACTRSVMGPLDHTISGYRGMGHALAAGIDMDACMAELMGRINGCSKGKGGAPASFYAPHLRHWGCHASAGSQTPLAAGLAFGLVHREEAGAVVCFLGDGAANTGAFHESLNLAALFDLPVVYLIENNGYAMGTSVARSSAFRDCLARRAEAYDMDWDQFPDADPYEMRARIAAALERARTRRRPTLLEIDTYRYYGCTVADANHKRYRTPEEIEERKSRDPLARWKATLIAEGLLEEASAATIHEEARSEAEAAVTAARKGDKPEVSDIQTDVYWEWDQGAGNAGRLFFD